jgi:hypothetical protein
MPLLWTLLLNGTLALAGYWTARHGFRMPPGLPRGLAAFTLAWAWATLGMEVLGPLGGLSYGPLLGWTAAGLVIAGVLQRRDVLLRPTSSEGRERPGSKPGQSWEASAVLAVGLVIWLTLLHALTALLGPVKVVSDGPIYHLYFAARWWKAGRLFLVAAPFGETVVTYFPAVGDLWFAWLMVGWGGDRLAKVGQVPFLLVAASAAVASARWLGAGRSAAVIAACWLASVYPIFLFTIEPNVDTIFVAGYLLSAYFLLRYALGDEGHGALGLSALAAGGVLGTKPTGIVFGGLLLGTAAAAVILKRESFRQAIGHLIVLGLAPLVMVGYWYGHSTWLTGNPLYPLHLKLFGHVWLAGWYGSDVMRLSPYYLPMHDWRALGDILLAVFDPRLAPVWLAALAGAWAWAWTWPPRRPSSALALGVWAFSGLAVANLAAYWLLVPYRTQQRFMFQAAGLLAVPLARLFDRSRWLRIAGAMFLVLHLATAQGWPFCPWDQEPPQELPWDLSRAIPNVVPPLLVLPGVSMLSRSEPLTPDDLSWTAVMLALGAGSFAVAWLWGRPGPRSILPAALGSLALLAAGLTIALPDQSSRRTLFFPRFPEYYRGWLQLDARSGRSGSRIAYAGTNLPYYLLGAELRNNIQYVNIDAHRGWLMHDYQRRAAAEGAPTWPNPWPSWDRQHPDYDAWMTNLRAEGIQLLVVASMNHPRGALPDVDRDGFPIERRWAEEHPESFAAVYRDDRYPKFRIFRVRTEGEEVSGGRVR